MGILTTLGQGARRVGGSHVGFGDAPMTARPGASERCRGVLNSPSTSQIREAFRFPELVRPCTVLW